MCWFSDRGSPPLVCDIQVLTGAAKSWQYQALVERTYLELLERKPEPEEVAHWQQVLEGGGRLEWLLAEVCKGLASQQDSHLERRLGSLRKKLLTDIEAMVAE